MDNYISNRSPVKLNMPGRHHGGMGVVYTARDPRLDRQGATGASRITR